jgi:hypothetical protein
MVTSSASRTGLVGWTGLSPGRQPALLEEDRAATVAPVRQALGWRYITLQIVDIDTIHNDLRNKGVRECLAPVTFGNVARISMILDPNGSWIELSRRASIAGSQT